MSVTPEEWTSAILDVLAKIGGLTAILALACQNLIKGWISDKFATKGDLRKHAQALEKQTESEKLKLRSAALQKLVEKRFESVDRLSEAARTLSGALIDYTANLKTEWYLQTQGATPEHLADLKSVSSDARSTLVKVASIFNESLYAAQPYVPYNIVVTGFEIYALVGTLHKDLTPKLAFDDENYKSVTAYHKALSEFNRELRSTILDTPNLADQVKPASLDDN